jgi:hypothetical protein
MRRSVMACVWKSGCCKDEARRVNEFAIKGGASRQRL